MRNILSILNELAATSSTNDKVYILQREKNNILLKNVFAAAYNPMINYFQKIIPEYINMNICAKDLSWALIEIKDLSNRTYTGNYSKTHLINILTLLNVDDAIVIERIIQRDLRCGTSDTLASRVWPGFVPSFAVMLCHKDISGIKYPAIANKKSDGSRAHIYFDGNHALAVSRQGRHIELHGVLDNDIGMLIKAGQTLDGELVCYRDGKMMDRQSSNGYLNKAIKGTITKEEAQLMHFECWDIPDFTSTIPYKDRISALLESEKQAKSFDQFERRVNVVETVTVNSPEEAQAFFENMISRGFEGAVIKNMNSVWVGKRTSDQGKLKSIEVSDIEIVDIVEGQGKYTGMLGNFICRTSDGLLEVGVGTGFSDKDRVEYFDKKYIGMIAEVAYNQITQNKNTGMKSLFLPRFLSIRNDKSVANTLAELK